MEFLTLLLPGVLAGAAAGRWTRMHPLVAALAVGAVPGVLGMLAAAAFATEGGAILLMGTFAWLLGSAAAAFGAFIGWLRRKHIERTA